MGAESHWRQRAPVMMEGPAPGETALSQSARRITSVPNPKRKDKLQGKHSNSREKLQELPKKLRRKRRRLLVRLRKLPRKLKGKVRRKKPETPRRNQARERKCQEEERKAREKHK